MMERGTVEIGDSSGSFALKQHARGIRISLRLRRISVAPDK